MKLRAPRYPDLSREDHDPSTVERFDLDLRGLLPPFALRRLDFLLLVAGQQGVKALWVRLDQEAGSGRMALFVPVGRRLLAAWGRGDIAGCRPLSAAEGGGYHVFY